jgi:hypothetical protein
MNSQLHHPPRLGDRNERSPDVYRAAAVTGLKYGVLAYRVVSPIRYALFDEPMISPSALSTFSACFRTGLGFLPNR